MIFLMNCRWSLDELFSFLGAKGACFFPQVHKRRVYDVVNALEGAELLIKVCLFQFVWVVADYAQEW